MLPPLYHGLILFNVVVGIHWAWGETLINICYLIRLADIAIKIFRTTTDEVKRRYYIIYDVRYLSHQQVHLSILHSI